MALSVSQHNLLISDMAFSVSHGQIVDYVTIKFKRKETNLVRIQQLF